MNSKVGQNPRAFTLTELLVVIAIIGLLMALLLPSLSKARQHARSAQCLANLSEIGRAVQMYASDSKGYVVPVAYRSAASRVNRESWATLMVNAKYLTSVVQNPTTSESAGYGVFRCPEGIPTPILFPASYDATVPIIPPTSPTEALARTPWRMTSAASGITLDVFYAINGQTTADTNPVSARGEIIYPTRRVPNDAYLSDYRLNKIVQIKRSSEVALIFDGVLYNGPLSNPNRIAASHLGQRYTNILFLDGHAESVARKLIPTTTTQFSTISTLNTQFPWPRWRIDG